MDEKWKHIHKKIPFFIFVEKKIFYSSENFLKSDSRFENFELKIWI
jgi:hypothetical protein